MYLTPNSPFPEINYKVSPMGWASNEAYSHRGQIIDS